MSAIAGQVTGNSTVCWTVCTGVHQIKHQNFALLALCEGNLPVGTGPLWGGSSGGPVMWQMMPCHDVIMPWLTAIHLVIKPFKMFRNTPWKFPSLHVYTFIYMTNILNGRDFTRFMFQMDLGNMFQYRISHFIIRSQFQNCETGGKMSISLCNLAVT